MNILVMTSLTMQDIDSVAIEKIRVAAGDKAETLAIKRVFGEHSKNIKINATKSIIGHSSGAAGAMEAIACIKSIQDQIVHPTINLIDEDEDCDLDYTPGKSKQIKIEHALSNSFGFGGQNSCIIISKFEK